MGHQLTAVIAAVIAIVYQAYKLRYLNRRTAATRLLLVDANNSVSGKIAAGTKISLGTTYVKQSKQLHEAQRLLLLATYVLCAIGMVNTLRSIKVIITDLFGYGFLAAYIVVAGVIESKIQAAVQRDFEALSIADLARPRTSKLGPRRRAFFQEVGRLIWRKQ